MEYLTRPELKKLSALCHARIAEAEEVMESEDASGLEKALADHDKCWMLKLSAKLDRIADSDAKRIEITW